jgi:hypothetical protein
MIDNSSHIMNAHAEGRDAKQNDINFIGRFVQLLITEPNFFI